VETPRKFITAKLSIRKPGSSSVLIIWKNRKLCSNKFTWGFHKQNYYMFYRHANVQRTYIKFTSVFAWYVIYFLHLSASADNTTSALIILDITVKRRPIIIKCMKWNLNLINKTYWILQKRRHVVKCAHFFMIITWYNIIRKNPFDVSTGWIKNESLNPNINFKTNFRRMYYVLVYIFTFIIKLDHLLPKRKLPITITSNLYFKEHFQNFRNKTIIS
jgi:hypothetical protein